jgi:hypothetical protein
LVGSNANGGLVKKNQAAAVFAFLDAVELD